MQKANMIRQKLPAVAFSATRPISSAAARRGIIFNDKSKNDPLDNSKEASDTVAQAKTDEGSTPAQQHAKATGHPVSGESNTNPGPSKDQPKKDSPGLGSKHAERGEKPGEEAVNPAVKGSS